MYIARNYLLHLLRDPILLTRITLRINKHLLDRPRPPSRINIHHELRIRPRQDLNVPLDGKSIIELPRRLDFAMFDVSDLGVDTDLDSRELFITRDFVVIVDAVFALSCYERRVAVDYRRCEVEN